MKLTGLPEWRKPYSRLFRHFFAAFSCLAPIWLMTPASAQSLFEADWYSFHVYQFAPDGTRSTFASAMYGPVALAFDAQGNLFVGTMDGGGIIKVTPDGTKSTFASTAAFSLAFDRQGNLFAANTAGSVSKFSADGTQLSVVPMQSPYGIAINSVGDLFVANSWGQTILRMTPTGATSVFATGLSAWDLAFDSNGNLFDADFGSGNIYEFSANGTRTTFASGLIHPAGLAFDSLGDLFVSDYGNGNIYEYTTNGIRSTFATGSDYEQPVGLAFQTVPEPAVSWLTAGAVLACIFRSRCFRGR